MKIFKMSNSGYRHYKSVTELHRKTGIKFKRPFSVETTDDMWYIKGLDQWLSLDVWEEKYKMFDFSNKYYAYSVKAIKRKIKKWNVPIGTKFTISDGYYDGDFIIIKNKDFYERRDS